MNEIKIFSPATVANVACGFDVLGFALKEFGDTMYVRKSDKRGINITQIEGFNLSKNTFENVAGVSALAMLESLDINHGFDIRIDKKIKPGSGIGSSSASAAGSVFAMNELLNRPFSKDKLVEFAMKGEAVASQSEHADNVAPAIYGGITFVKSTDPLEILPLPVPEDLFAVIIHPLIEVKTSESRALLPSSVDLSLAVQHSANLGGLVHALHTNNYELIRSSLNDLLIEPHRAKLIPYFSQIKSTMLKSGALGCGISGSGPSVFALCNGEDIAERILENLTKELSNASFEFDVYSSSINNRGIIIL